MPNQKRIITNINIKKKNDKYELKYKENDETFITEFDTIDGAVNFIDNYSPNFFESFGLINPLSLFV